MIGQAKLVKQSALKLFEEERWFTLTGLLGFLLAGICAVWIVLNGAEVTPGGDMSKAFSFNAALGIFMLSTAAIIPLSAMSRRARVSFRWTYILLALYSYFAENVQNFRGVNPRFVKDGSAFDYAVGNGFALVALLLVISYIMFAGTFFRSKAYRLRPAIVLGIRYSAVAILLSFAAGIWISVGNGRFVGLGGNLIWLHGLGFHALQVIPLVGWLTEFTTLTPAASRRLVHVTGIGFLLGLLAIGWQTYLGLPILEWSLFPIIAGHCFFITVVMGGLVLSNIINNRRKHEQVLKV